MKNRLLKILTIFLTLFVVVGCGTNSSNIEANNDAFEGNKCLIRSKNTSNSYKLQVSEMNGYPSRDSLIGKSVIITLNDNLLNTYPQIYLDISDTSIDVYYYVCEHYFRMGSLSIVEKKTHDYYKENKMIDGVYPFKIMEDDNIYLVADLPFDMAIGQSFYTANPDFNENDETSLQEKEEYLEFETMFVNEEKYLELFQSLELLEE